MGGEPGKGSVMEVTRVGKSGREMLKGKMKTEACPLTLTMLIIHFNIGTGGQTGLENEQVVKK